MEIFFNIVFVILNIFSIVAIYIIYNLLKKVEKYEDAIVSQSIFIDKFTGVVEYVDKKLEELDHKGSFKSDDEIGFFFEEVKVLNGLLNAYNQQTREKEPNEFKK